MEQHHARPEQAPRQDAVPARPPSPPPNPSSPPAPAPAAAASTSPHGSGADTRDAPAGAGQERHTGPTGEVRVPRPYHGVGQALAGSTATGAGRGERSEMTAGPTRFTAVGVGVLTCGVTLLGGAFDALVLDGPGVFFGVVFVCVCFFAAARVRSSDLAAAPISAPIAFALTLMLTAPSSGDGFSGQLIAVATGLAVHAGWLYAGTLVAAALAGLRHFALRSRRSP